MKLREDIMSQEKVDRYKEQKANRKQMIAKEKREKFLCIQVSHDCHHPSLCFTEGIILHIY